LVACGLLVVLSCTTELERIQNPPHAIAIPSGGPWSSMTYLARTDSGVIAIDLGWMNGSAMLREALAELGATPDDVRYVFLTHAHRDHVVGWRDVRGARFVLGEGEVPYFTGVKHYRGLVPRVGDWLNAPDYPAPGELTLVPVATDTTFVFGSDTLRAYPIPGHTAGSTAYLFRGVLFVGDAINRRPLVGFRGARPEMSDDVERSRASVRDLWRRIGTLPLRSVCTAHAKCTAADSSIRNLAER
jgi:glyoxylase-like metal-dependent hydrolase (beta-lactamase superfamily II)